jgi:uncharacterized protein
VTDTATQSPARIRLDEELRQLGRVVVAFSGGADSAFLAHVATSVLGTDSVICVTADSASLAPEERADCAALALEWGLRHQFIDTSELDRPDYVENDLNRCYHCKTELMDALQPIADEEQAIVILGVNLDDLGEHRPGQRAAEERGALFPMVKAGLTKAEIRALSAELGLRTFDKPAAACLASRVPHGTPVTLGVLSAVAKGESALRQLGFRELRVRHYGSTARLEIGLGELPDVLARRSEIVDALHAAGYRYVTLDLEGLRSGNLSQDALAHEVQPTGGAR